MKKYLSYIILAIVALVLGCGWYQEHSQRNDELTQMNEKVEELKESEEKSVISSRMSDQLNDIAEEQKLVLDQQLEEVTKLQSETQSLLLRSEKDKKAAIEARNQAAVALEEAERQRALAEANRLEAVEAKNSADTLSYQALASSLAATSILKFGNGEYQLAFQLAYLGYVYSRRYGVDPYENYVFKALMLPSGLNYSQIEFQGHRLNKIVELDKNHLMILGSTGEAAILTDFQHSLSKKVMAAKIETISRKPDLDFRDAVMGPDCPILLSYDGKLFEYKETKDEDLAIHQLPIGECLSIFNYDDTRYAVVGRHHVCIVSKTRFTGKIIETTQADSFCVAGLWKGKKAFIDTKGGMYEITANGISLIQKFELPAQATSFLWNDDSAIGAIGCKDGSILLVKNDGTEILKGHSSAVSGFGFDGEILYSGSYDAQAIRWNLRSSNKEPLILYECPTWIRSVYFQKPDFLCGLMQNGRMMFMCTDVEISAKAVCSRIKRNLTQEEWNTYVGNKIPYEKIIDTVK